MEIVAHVYILTTQNNTTLYTGASTAISSRIWEHKTQSNPGSFTARYNINKLVFLEGFRTEAEAIAREKYIKGKSRKWKVKLIESKNPQWTELQPPMH